MAMLSMLACAAAAFATTIRPITVEQLTEGSSLVIEGRAVSSYAAWDRKQQNIYTYTSFAVKKVLKGGVRGDTVVVKQIGGQVDDTEERLVGVHYFAAGEEAVLFLFPSPNADGTMLVTGLMQGRFAVRRAGGAATVSNGVPVPAHSASTREPRAPVAQDSGMTLTTLEQRVRSAAKSKAEE